MAKLTNAPSGTYTAGEAIKKLNMPATTFHHYVKIGKIKKIVPPGRSEGFYEKAYIDKMARASQLFTLQYATDSSTFEVATAEDAKGIYEVIASLWGTLNTTPIETRLSWYKSNPEIDYVIKQEGIVTGYVTLMPLRHDVIEKLMSGKMRGWDIKAEDILPFIPGTPIECYTGVAVRADVYKKERYGMRLIGGILDTMQGLAKRGINITKIYAVSDTPNGVKLSRGLGFEENPPAEGSTFNQYVLNVEKSESPFAQEYRQLLTTSKLKSNENEKASSQKVTAELTAETADNNGQSRTVKDKKQKNLV